MMVNEKSWYYDRAYWEETFSLIPRRCDISNRWIWGKQYRGTRYITGPGDPVVLTYWHEQTEHLIWILKQ